MAKRLKKESWPGSKALNVRITGQQADTFDRLAKMLGHSNAELYRRCIPSTALLSLIELTGLAPDKLIEEAVVEKLKREMATDAKYPIPLQVNSARPTLENIVQLYIMWRKAHMGGPEYEFVFINDKEGYFVKPKNTD